MMQRPGGWIVALAGLMCASACATSSEAGDPFTRSWREVTQVADRFAVFISEPGLPREAERISFRMVFVYMPGVATVGGRDVAWQEYSAMTLDCARNQVRTGPRTRYASDGTALASDEAVTFADIVSGTSVAFAAAVKCGGVADPLARRIPDGPGWMAAARRAVASPPPAAG